MYTADVWALICHRPRVAIGPPTLSSICPVRAPEVRQLEKRLHRSNSAARGQIAFKFHKIVFCGARKAAALSKLTKG